MPQQHSASASIHVSWKQACFVLACMPTHQLVGTRLVGATSVVCEPSSLPCRSRRWGWNRNLTKSHSSKCINTFLVITWISVTKLFLLGKQLKVFFQHQGLDRSRFQRQAGPKLSVWFTNSRGWGLFLDQDVKRGSFIIEYLGELVSNEELKWVWCHDEENDPQSRNLEPRMI